MNETTPNPSGHEVVGRAAHDLNNICATLLGFASLAGETTDSGSALALYLSEITSAANRAKVVAERLQALAQTMRAAGGA